MSSPKLMLLDEPSAGLSPLFVTEVFRTLRSLCDQGITLVVVEQNARIALGVADHGYVMEGGRIVLEGLAEDLRENADVKEFYLGLHSEGDEKKSFKEVKHYKRRKRWAS